MVCDGLWWFERSVGVVWEMFVSGLRHFVEILGSLIWFVVV